MHRWLRFAALLGAAGLVAESAACAVNMRPRFQRQADPRAEERRLDLARKIAAPMTWARVEELTALGQADEAIRLASQLLVRSPRDANGLVLRGRAYMWRNDCDLAEADFTQSIALDPGKAAAYAWRADAWRCKKDDGRALADLDTAISRRMHALELSAYVEGKRTSHTINLHMQRALVYRRLENPDLALADFTRAIEMEPGTALYHHLRSDVYLELGRFAEAMADAQTCVGLLPNFFDAFDTMGLVRFFEGNYEEALRYYARALDVAPKEKDALAGGRRRLHVNRAVALWVSGRREDAVLEAKKAVGSGDATTDALAYFHLAFFEHEQGRRADAQSYFARAKELAPGLLESRQGRERLYSRYPANRDFFAREMATARQYLEGVPAAMSARELEPVAPPPSAAAVPSVAISGLTVEPPEPAAGAAFDIRMSYRVGDPATNAARVKATFRFEIARGGRVLFRSEAIEIDCPNGEDGAWVQHMNPSRQTGRFTVKASLELKGRAASREAEMRIR